MLTSAFRIAAFVLLAIIVLLVIGITLLTLPPGEKLLTGILESKLTSALGQPVKIGSFETNLLSRIEIENLEVAAEDTAPVLRIEHVRIGYHAWPLLHKEIALEKVAINGVRVDIQRGNDGSVGIPLLDLTLADSSGVKENEQSSASFFTVSVGEIALRDAEITYRDSASRLSAALFNLSGDLTTGRDSSYFGSWSLDSVIAEFEEMPLHAGQLAATGGYRSGIVTIETLNGKIEQLDLKAHCGIALEQDSLVEGQLELKGDIQSTLQKISHAFDFPLFESKGELDLKLTAAGAFASPEYQLTAALPSISTRDFEVRDVHLTAHGSADSLHVDSLIIDGLGGNFIARGLIVLDTVPQVQAQVSLSEIDLRKLWALHSQSLSPYGGKLGGQVDLIAEDSDVFNWEISSDLRTRQTSYQGKGIRDLNASINLSQGKAQFSLEHEFLTADGSVDIRADSLRGSYDIEINDLQPLAAFAEMTTLRGSIAAQGVLSGSVDLPMASFNIQGQGISYQNCPVDRLRAEGTFSDGNIDLKSLTASGQLEEIDTLNPPLGIDDLSGGFSYDLTASGSFEHPGADLELRLTEPKYTSIKFESGLIRASLRDSMAAITQCDLHGESLKLALTGDYDLNTSEGEATVLLVDKQEGGQTGKLNARFEISDPHDLTVDASGSTLDLSLLSTLLPDSLDISGLLDFDLNFEGSMDRPNVDLVAALRHGQFENFGLDSAFTSLSFKRSLLHVDDLRAFILGEEFTANGSVELTRDSDGGFSISDRSATTGALNVPELDLRSLRPFLSESMELAGRAAVDLNWNGTINQPNIRGNCHLENGMLVLADVADSLEDLDLRITLADSVITIDSAGGIFMDAPFRAKGHISASHWERFQVDLLVDLAQIGGIHSQGFVSRDSLDLYARVDSLELDLFQELLPDLDTLAGELDCNVTVSGSPDKPVVAGYLHVRGLTLKPTGYTKGLERGEVRIVFTEDKVKLDTLILSQDEGVLIMSGEAALRQGEVVDLDLTASGSKLEIGREGEFVLRVQSSNLTYKRENDLFQLRGDVLLDESRLTLDFGAETVLPWAKSVERVETELPHFLQQTRMDVRVRDADKLWIDNNLARMRLNAELGIIGSPALPNFTGRLSIEEGYLLYLDRKFKVKNGIVYFTDPNEFNPEIDLLAETQVTSYEGIQGTTYLITIKIKGPLDQLQVSLTSEPALDNPDIVSMLTLGATRNQLTGRNGNGQSALLRRAEALTSNKISGLVGGQVESLLGLDQVSVEGNLFSPERTQGIQLLATKQISDRAKITYKTTVGQLNEQSIRLDYRLSRHFSFEGQTDRYGTARISFKYGLLFK